MRNENWYVAPLLMIAGCGTADKTSVPCVQSALVGRVVTPAATTADAILIEGAFIKETFERREDLPALDRKCVRVLPDDAVVLPGLVDGHAHLLGIGLREMTLNLAGTGSIDELQQKVRDASNDPAFNEVVYGRGWIETGWPQGRMPTAADLDQAVRDRPVILSRADGHAAVVNTTALVAAGITDDTPDPDGGRIIRDTEGRATGMLIDRAEDLVAGLLPTLTSDRRAAALKRGADVYAERGWTGVHNMSVSYQDDAILRDLAANGELPIRVMNYFVPDAIDVVAASGRTCDDEAMVCTMGIKFYVDGALGSRGALLFEPYADEPGTLGLQLISAEDAKTAYSRALAADIQVTTHAIGDRGNDLVLSWYDEVLTDTDDHRWRIEHAQIVRPEDISRFADSGVIASMQPSHAIGDLFFAPDRLGDARLDGAYAWQSMLDVGARVVGGSDAPVEVGDPRIELHAATKRTSLDGFSAANWRPEEALSNDAALAIFTSEPAHAVFQEDTMGKIAPGYRADFTVLSSSPFDTPWDEVRVVMTMVNGRTTYPAQPSE